MQVLGINSFTLPKTPKVSDKVFVPRVSLLKADTVSFGAMKKTQFVGIDLMMVNQLRAPIQNFNSYEDFQNYCQTILDEKYLGK